jgi:hypothetical protein
MNENLDNTTESTNLPAPWKKGMPSPNPKGRPKQPKSAAEVRALARENTVGAIQTLVRVHSNPKSPPAARVAAASEILNRGWGRPAGDIENAEALVIKVIKFAEQPDMKTIEGEIEND